MGEKEMERLLRIEDVVGSQVIGQGTAVSVLARALRRSRADLKDPEASNRIICIFRTNWCW